MERALQVARCRLIDVRLIGLRSEEPRGESFVELSSELLRDAAVRRLGDQGMGEPPPTRGFVFGVDEPAAFHGPESMIEGLVGDVTDEGTDRGDPEPPTLDRCMLQDRSRRRIQIVQAGGQERMDGRWVSRPHHR